MRPLILSSTSVHRKMLLERLKIPFQCAAPEVDETPLQNEKPADMVVRLAGAKAQAVAENYPGAVIIGADQIGLIGSTILCKPLTHDNAVSQLNLISGKNICFLTGMCVLDTVSHQRQYTLETYDFTIRHLTADMIKNYLKKEDVLNCAGSFKLEGAGIALVAAMTGKDPTSVTGLPLIRLVEMLETSDIHVF